MTPAARVQAAIEVLDRVLAGTPAEQALTGWARASRFAGSGDRAAVRDHVFDALRCLRSRLALAGALQPSGRALMIGALDERFPGDWFGAGGHAPAALTPAEAAARADAPQASDLPDAVRLDCPDWLETGLRRTLGSDFAPVLAAMRQRAPVFLRANLARGDRGAAMAALAAEGIDSRPHPLADSAIEVVAGAARIRASAAYTRGLVELQDASSQAAVALLPMAPGMRVLDYCAGGGGKALAIAARGGTGPGVEVVAHDAVPARMKDLPVRAARAGARIGTLTPSAATGGFDLVLVDAPCSGTGTWRRTPDAKWRLTPERLAEYSALQPRILQAARAHVRPGGLLAYMTCSLLREENEEVVAGVLAGTEGAQLETQRRFSPLDGGDGFYAAVMRLA